MFQAGQSIHLVPSLPTLSLGIAIKWSFRLGLLAGTF